jgi:hypothetical protein
MYLQVQFLKLIAHEFLFCLRVMLLLLMRHQVKVPQLIPYEKVFSRKEKRGVQGRIILMLELHLFQRGNNNNKLMNLGLLNSLLVEENSMF